MLLLAGTSGFFWHSAFGLDGLLSPPHLTLTIGMLAGSVGALIGITSSYFVILNNSNIQEKRHNNNIGKFKNNEKIPISLYTTLTIIGILPIWMSSSGLIYMFSLPFSDTEYYNFNLEPITAATIRYSNLSILNIIHFSIIIQIVGRNQLQKEKVWCYISHWFDFYDYYNSYNDNSK